MLRFLICLLPLAFVGCDEDQSKVSNNADGSKLISKVEVLDFMKRKIDAGSSITDSLVEDLNALKWIEDGGKPPGAPDWYLECQDYEGVTSTIGVFGGKIFYDASTDRYAVCDWWKQVEQRLP